MTESRFSVILTQDPDEVKKAQALRYKVFFDADDNQIDEDMFDAVFQHLIVKDGEDVVGTYRIRFADLDKDDFQLYTATEFDLSKLTKKYRKLLELGRSCVHPDYRSGDVINLLWKGIGDYTIENNIDFMIGCASFSGTDIEEHRKSLSYLHHYHRVDDDICPTPLPKYKTNFTPLSKEEIGSPRRALAELPALIKGYARVGARFGDGIVIDEHCKTIDVCGLLTPKQVTDRYTKKFFTAE